MHNKQSCGRWKAWHRGCWCITAVVCLTCACFGNEVAFFELFHFLTCCLFCLGLQTGSFSQSYCQYLVWWITHERLVLTKDILFSRKMAGSLVAVEKLREIGVLWGAGWCLKTNLLCTAFLKAFESRRNEYSSVTTQFLALHFVVAACRIFLQFICNCNLTQEPSKLRVVNGNLTEWNQRSWLTCCWGSDVYISFQAVLSYCVLEKQHVHPVCWFLCLDVRAYNRKMIQHLSRLQRKEIQAALSADTWYLPVYSWTAWPVTDSA